MTITTMLRMKFTLLYILTTLLSFKTYSQETYLKYFTNGFYSFGHVMRLDTDGKIIVLSRKIDTTLNGIDFNLFKLDDNGKVISNKTYNIPYDNYVEDFMVQNNNYFMAGFSVNQSATNILLYKLDKSDSSKNQFTEYNNISGEDIFANSIFNLEDSYYLIGSKNVSGRNRDGLIIKIDSTGKILWKKNYGSLKNDWFVSGIAINNNEIIAVGSTYKEGNIEPHILIIKTDSSGNELWQKVLKRANDPDNRCAMSAFDVIEAKNKKIYVAGYNSTFCDLSQFYFPNPVGLLACFDADGTELWTKEYHLYYDTTEGQQVAYFRQSFVNIIETSDGNLVCLDQSGGYVPNDPFYTEQSQISIVKFNLNGDTIWTRVYGNPYKIETPYDIIETKDKGIAVCGRYADVHRPFDSVQTFVLKLDECGCLIPDCDPNCKVTGVSTIQNNWDVNIYPNPANDKLYIEANHSIRKYSIYNLVGNKILESELSSNLIEINTLNHGYYFIEFVDSQQNSRIYKFIKN